MSRLVELHTEHAQSPWLDNITRGWLRSGEIGRWIERGVRGITSNPSIFAKAMAGADYDAELAELTRSGCAVTDAYWHLVTADIEAAADLLRPLHDASGGEDGFVSVEVDPRLAHDAEATVEAARILHSRIDRPNLYIKVPATSEGITAIRQLIAEGISVNVTLIFGLNRYAEVLEAYLGGLEDRLAAHGPTAGLNAISSVASFFISRVDTEIDRRLEGLATEEARALQGCTAIAQARSAYAMAEQAFTGPRWEALTAHGAAPQRPLWASTSTKNPAYPDTLYVDQLIGPGTVNTLPEATLEAFDDHGALARTIDADPQGNARLLERIGALIDLDEVETKLEAEGVTAFADSFVEILDDLQRRTDQLAR